MFSLFYGLWKYMFSKTEFHVLILGIEKSGKTTLLEKLKSLNSNIEGLPPDRIVPTVRLNIGRIKVANSKLVFWDLGDQIQGSLSRNFSLTLLEKLKSLNSNIEGLPPDRIVPTVGLNIGRIEVANSKLVFWDLGGQPGLRSIWEKYYEEAHAVIYVIDASSPARFEDSKSALEKVLRHEDLQAAPLLILANKQDLSEAVSTEELARYLDLKKLDERVFMFEAVSAFDGMGINESVDWLVNVMERSKRTEMLRTRAGLNGPASS